MHKNPTEIYSAVGRENSFPVLCPVVGYAVGNIKATVHTATANFEF